MTHLPYSITDVRLIESIADAPGQPGIVEITIQAHELEALEAAVRRHVTKSLSATFGSPFQRGCGWAVKGTRHE